MLYFSSDYMETVHQDVLGAIASLGREANTGYGYDNHSINAEKIILAKCGLNKGSVKFLAGGTQTNKTVISTFLRKYQGVVAATSGHISTHEAGAIEHSGHKVLTLPGKDGKILPDVLRGFFEEFYADENNEHSVQPGMVYISHPTEYGTLYTKSELAQLRNICDEHKVLLYLDGARLGYGLAANTDVTLEDVARYTDIFYIGGTKVGALFGEALVITDKVDCPCLLTNIKQEGALLAKGWVAAVQFEALFSNDLYMKISKNAVDRAMEIREILLEKGYELYMDSPTNQQFAVVDDETLAKLEGKVSYGFWEKLPSGKTVIRFAASWATTKEEVAELKNIL